MLEVFKTRSPFTVVIPEYYWLQVIFPHSSGYNFINKHITLKDSIMNKTFKINSNKKTIKILNNS